ncbi:MAG: hypothetical protein ACP5JO_03390 [Candidatus Ratteibacteria bacterium]
MGKNAADNQQQVDINLAKKLYLDEEKYLHFYLIIYGDDPNFPKRTKVYLTYNGKKIRPISFWLPPYTEFSRDYYNIAKGETKFSKSGIPDNAIVTITVEIAPLKGRIKVEFYPGYTTNYTFDLSKYR